MARVTEAHVRSREEAIIGAALSMFARKGVAGATMQEVAAEAGLSAGAIYRYFPGKEQLVEAVFERIGENDRSLFAELAADMQSSGAALMNLGRVVSGSLSGDAVREQTMLVLEWILAEARLDGPSQGTRRVVEEAQLLTIEDLVCQAQEAGGLDEAIDAHAFAVILLSCLVGVRVVSLELQESVDMDQVFEALQDVLFRMAPVRDAEEVGS
jgi:AcrR family transcriptional regulator